MTAFSDLLDSLVPGAGQRKPTRVVTIPVNAFADSWLNKPSKAVQIGIKLLSEKDLQTARAEAERESKNLHDDPDNLIEAYNDALMRWAVARATCRPDDSDEPFFEMAEDTVGEKLTPWGLQRLFDEILALSVEESPLYKPASDETLSFFASRIAQPETWSTIPERKAKHLRRMITYLMESMSE